MTERAALRLHVEADLAEGVSVVLDDRKARYVRTVMRRASGDPLLLFNGRDGEWRGHLAVQAKGRVLVALARQTRSQAKGPDLWLMLAPLKRGPMDLVMEKATELGVGAIWPVST